MGKAIERKADAALREREERKREALTRAKLAGGFAAVGLVFWYLPLISLFAYPAFAGALLFTWLAAKKWLPDE